MVLEPNDQTVGLIAPKPVAGQRSRSPTSEPLRQLSTILSLVSPDGDPAG